MKEESGAGEDDKGSLVERIMMDIRMKNSRVDGVMLRGEERWKEGEVGKGHEGVNDGWRCS